MEKYEALFGAWRSWKSVDVQELSTCKVALYSGSNDHNKEMIRRTTTERNELKKYGVDTICFEGLGHEELITNRSVCSSWVLEHL